MFGKFDQFRQFCFAFPLVIYILFDFLVLLEKIPPLFDLKIVYSYVIEVTDSESDLGLHGKPLVSEIFIFL